jgi:hypothetical protein
MVAKLSELQLYIRVLKMGQRLCLFELRQFFMVHPAFAQDEVVFVEAESFQNTGGWNGSLALQKIWHNSQGSLSEAFGRIETIS